MADDLQLLKTHEVASLLGVDRTCIWCWYTTGKFPKPIKLGRATRFRRSDVEAWIASRPAPNDGQPAT